MTHFLPCLISCFQSFSGSAKPAPDFSLILICFPFLFLFSVGYGQRKFKWLRGARLVWSRWSSNEPTREGKKLLIGPLPGFSALFPLAISCESFPFPPIGYVPASAKFHKEAAEFPLQWRWSARRLWVSHKTTQMQTSETEIQAHCLQGFVSLWLLIILNGCNLGGRVLIHQFY